MSPDDVPPDDLAESPALGVLAVLGSALRVARWMLIVQHPELFDTEDDRAYWRPSDQTAQCARRVVRASIDLDRALLAYRESIPPAISATEGDDTIPF